MRSASSASSTPMRCRSMVSRRFNSAASIELGALDILFFGFLLAQDAGQRDLLFLGDSRRLDGFAGSNVGFLDRAVARDFERPDPFLLGNAGGFGRLARRDAGYLERLVAVDLQFAGALLGGDAARSEGAFARDARSLHCLLRGNLGFLDRADLLDLEGAGLLVGGDPLGIDHPGLGNARLFGRLLGGNLGFVNRPRSFDLAPAGFLLIGDPSIGDDAVLLDAGLLDEFARLDLGFLDGAGTLDLFLPHLAFRGDARGVDRTRVGNACLLDLLARQDFLGFDRLGALDFFLPGFALGGDARLRDGLLVGNAGLFDGLARGNLRLFGFGLAQCAFARHLGALQGAANLDVALLIQPRGLALALDLERLPLGFEVAGADLDHRILFDVVAQFALGLDVFHQLGQALRIEAVRRVEEFEVGLVEVGDRHKFQLEAVLGQSLGGRGLDARDVVAALLVHLLHGHFRGDRTHRGNELAGQQRMQLLGFQRSPAKGRRGDRDRLACLLHADVKIGFDVNAHAIAGDDGVLLRPNDRHRQHVHVDGRELVNEGQHEGAAIDHDPLAEEAGAHERHFLGGAVIEPVHDIDRHDDHDQRDDQP